MLQTAATPYTPANSRHCFVARLWPYGSKPTCLLNTSRKTCPKLKSRPPLQRTVLATAAATRLWLDGSKLTCSLNTYRITCPILQPWHTLLRTVLTTAAAARPRPSSKHRFSTQGGSGRCRRLGDSRVFGGTARRRYPAKSRFCWTCAATHRDAALRLCAAAPLLRLTLASSFMRPAQIPGALAWPGPRPSTSSPPGINYRRVLNT